MDVFVCGTPSKGGIAPDVLGGSRPTTAMRRHQPTCDAQLSKTPFDSPRHPRGELGLARALRGDAGRISFFDKTARILHRAKTRFACLGKPS